MDTDFKYSNKVLALPLFFVLSLWAVYWVQIRFDYDFVENGILPRTISGLQGVVFSPFIHSDLAHLYNNSLPLLVMLAALQYFYAKETFSVIVLGIICSGLGTWLIGRTSYHIGASGLIYVLFSFIFFKGIRTKYYRLVALSLTVILIYGGMVWYVFPKVDEMVSWEGHLAGFVSGLFLAFAHTSPQYQKSFKYEWEHPEYDASQDKFMQRFDENGNFVNLPKPELEPDENYFYSNWDVMYEIVGDKKNESEAES
ncbi:rhomboid family intramembrane serine protease [Flavobacterium sp. UMI-01]|uniref:rhomboid family intramembrane serine protease n=1 Tax=Flavobacterium sp. UMI-01 TaxID=1441053 RepID=UPI001C7CB1DF|nr:rhomboid family intramembrane serine protease [Flavobacterium sp. UMI-01]GIZ07372.1 rhomboid family intramembrane serine protease [Flavobacterium sp. UMI-01]